MSGKRRGDDGMVRVKRIEEGKKIGKWGRSEKTEVKGRKRGITRRSTRTQERKNEG